MPSDHWYAEVFRALPDLVRHLLPGLAPGPRDSETTYMFRLVAHKKVAHHPDRHFHRRLAAETFRLLQQHEEVEHLRVLVLLAHRRLALGNRQPSPLQRFLKHDVTWLDLSALARRRDLDPALALRLLERRCGAISSESRRRLEALNLEQMEALALDLLDFRNGEDLAAWLERQEQGTLVLEQPETIK